MPQRHLKSTNLEALLATLETSTPDRRERLLESIRSENPALASLLKMKCLTAEEILRWKSSVVELILRELPADMRAHLVRSRSSNRPDLEAVATAEIALVRLVREMETDGRLDLTEISPAHSRSLSRAA